MRSLASNYKKHVEDRSLHAKFKFCTCLYQSEIRNTRMTSPYDTHSKSFELSQLSFWPLEWSKDLWRAIQLYNISRSLCPHFQILFFGFIRYFFPSVTQSKRRNSFQVHVHIAHIWDYAIVKLHAWDARFWVNSKVCLNLDKRSIRLHSSSITKNALRLYESEFVMSLDLVASR